MTSNRNFFYHSEEFMNCNKIWLLSVTIYLHFLELSKLCLLGKVTENLLNLLYSQEFKSEEYSDQQSTWKSTRINFMSSLCWNQHHQKNMTSMNGCKWSATRSMYAHKSRQNSVSLMVLAYSIRTSSSSSHTYIIELPLPPDFTQLKGWIYDRDRIIHFYILLYHNIVWVLAIHWYIAFS